VTRLQHGAVSFERDADVAHRNRLGDGLAASYVAASLRWPIVIWYENLTANFSGRVFLGPMSVSAAPSPVDINKSPPDNRCSARRPRYDTRALLDHVARTLIQKRAAATFNLG
jgi:hypothetical protein